MADTALVETLVQHRARFLGFVQRRVQNDADAEEILQTAFVRSVEKQHAIRADESIVPWFYRVLRNAVIDHYRHRAAGRRALEEVRHEFEPVAPSPEIERAVCRCFYELLPMLESDYAQLLQRVDLAGATIAEVATESGMTANNTRVKLHRARAAMRKQLLQCCGACARHGCLDCSCGQSAR